MSTTSGPIHELGTITLTVLEDHTIVRGHSTDSDYVETFYTPVVGPTAMLLLRKMGRILATQAAVPMPVEFLAASVGVGARQFSAAVQRLVMFRLAERTEAGLAVRTTIGTIPARHLNRLHPALILAHTDYHQTP